MFHPGKENIFRNPELKNSVISKTMYKQKIEISSKSKVKIRIPSLSSPQQMINLANYSLSSKFKERSSSTANSAVGKSIVYQRKLSKFTEKPTASKNLISKVEKNKRDPEPSSTGSIFKNPSGHKKAEFQQKPTKKIEKPATSKISISKTEKHKRDPESSSAGSSSKNLLARKNVEYQKKPITSKNFINEKNRRGPEPLSSRNSSKHPSAPRNIEYNQKSTKQSTTSKISGSTAVKNKRNPEPSTSGSLSNNLLKPKNREYQPAKKITLKISVSNAKKIKKDSEQSSSKNALIPKNSNYQRKPTKESVSELKNENTTNKEMECPICLESLQNINVASTVCGHIFCSACIKEIVLKKKYCPLCRNPLNLQQIHPIFL